LNFPYFLKLFTVVPLSTVDCPYSSTTLPLSLSLHAEPPLSPGAHLSLTFFSFSVATETAPASLSATAAIEEPPFLATADPLCAISSVSFHSFLFYSLFPSPPVHCFSLLPCTRCFIGFGNRRLHHRPGAILVLLLDFTCSF
jgi:hypothetical protein